ncbi:MAG: hypothetical protein GXP27_12705, partial [Planctomycetes bacterium]|nr:hypothetical protein [Planctomycetota bacterium]
MSMFPRKSLSVRCHRPSRVRSRGFVWVAVISTWVGAALPVPAGGPIGATPRGQTDSGLSDASRTLTGKPWIDMDYGPFLTATIEAPHPVGNIAYKGIMICVDRQSQAYVLFDSDLLRYAAGWSGGRITWTNLVFDGSHWTHPWIDGVQVFGNRLAPGWASDGRFDDPRPQPYGPLPRPWAHYQGLYLCGERVVLAYTVGRARILDSPGFETAGSAASFTRTLNVPPTATELLLRVIECRPAPTTFLSMDDVGPVKKSALPAADAAATANDANPAAGDAGKRKAAVVATAPASERLIVFGDLSVTRAVERQRAGKPAVPSEGLIAHWTFDQGTGKLARSRPLGLRAHLAGAQWANGKRSGGLRFDNKKRRATVDRSEAVRLGGRDYTIAAWIKSTAGGTLVSFTSKGKWVPGGKTLFIR